MSDKPWPEEMYWRLGDGAANDVDGLGLSAEERKAIALGVLKRLTPADIAEIVKRKMPGYALTPITKPFDQPYVEFAEAVAKRAHEGQIEKLTGRPYVEHLERVASQFAAPSAKATAWLHDIVEDTPITIADLEAMRFPDDVVNAVAVLTKRQGGDYDAFIKRIIAFDNPLAIAVKIADVRDHLRSDCPVELPPAMRVKYERALVALTAVAPND